MAFALEGWMSDRQGRAYWAAKWAEARQREVELHGHWLDRLLEAGPEQPPDIVPVSRVKQRRIVIKRRARPASTKKIQPITTGTTRQLWVIIAQIAGFGVAAAKIAISH